MTITEQALDLAPAGTITAQLVDLSWKDAWLHELRGPHGEWVRDSGALLKGATGRKASAVRVHDHVLYGKSEQTPGGQASVLRPMEVTSVRHHWEGSGKNKKRFTNMVLRDPDTGEEREQSVKDGTSVKLFPRESVKGTRASPSPPPSAVAKPLTITQQVKAAPSRQAAPPETVTPPPAASTARAAPALKASARAAPPAAAPRAPKVTPPSAPPSPPVTITQQAKATAPLRPPPAPRPAKVPGRFGHIQGGDVIPDPAQRRAATAEVQHGLDLQGKFVPKIAGGQTVELTSALGEGAGGKEETGGPILLDARITRAVGNVKKIQGLTPDEMQRREAAIGWFVPSDPQYSLADTTIAHEEGHAVADKVRPEAMNSIKLWGPLSQALGLPPPGFGGKNEFTGRPLSPSLVLLKWVSADKSGPGHTGAGAIEKTVSSYASAAVWELQAELWCEYTMNASPRPPAKIYGDYVMAQLKAQGDL